MKFLIMWFSSTSCHFVSLRSKYSPQHPALNLRLSRSIIIMNQAKVDVHVSLHGTKQEMGKKNVQKTWMEMATWTTWAYIGAFFFPLAPLLWSSLPYWSTGLITQFLIFSQAVGLRGRVTSSSQGLYLNRGQHKQKNADTVNIHAQGGIRTRNQGLRAIEDCTCLRPVGYRDRHRNV
jgi:hypothetical protein